MVLPSKLSVFLFTTFNQKKKSKEQNCQTHLSDFSSAIPRTASANTSGVHRTEGGAPSLSVTKALMALAGQRDEIDTPANKIKWRTFYTLKNR